MNTSSRTEFKPRLYLKEVFVKTILRCQNGASVGVRSTAKKKEGGGVATPKVMMVKRKSDSYELLPDRRLL